MFLILKFIILILILLICSQIGTIKAKSFTDRVDELKKVKSGLEVFRSKIEFTYEPIGEIFFEISKIIYDNKTNIFQNTIYYMKNSNVNEAWNQAVEENICLKKEDKFTIKMFGKLLGKTDKSGQINEINVTTKLLDRLIENAEKEREKNYKLFKTLGTTVGIGICIILI